MAKTKWILKPLSTSLVEGMAEELPFNELPQGEVELVGVVAYVDPQTNGQDVPQNVVAQVTWRLADNTFAKLPVSKKSVLAALVEGDNVRIGQRFLVEGDELTELD